MSKNMEELWYFILLKSFRKTLFKTLRSTQNSWLINNKPTELGLIIMYEYIYEWKCRVISTPKVDISTTNQEVPCLP